MSDSEVSEAIPNAPEPAPQPVDNRLFVLVLQHPQEGREALATAAIAVAALRRARLVTGLSWPSLSRVLGRYADPKRWAVLYLGSVQPAVLAPGREVIALGRGGIPMADADAILRGLDGIVLLDGTWKQAKTLWWRNPWLLKLHRLVLNPPLPARLGRLRREPRRDALSTLEAAALVLRHLEATPDAADALSAALDRLMAMQKNETPPLRPPWPNRGRRASG
jgi:DTW domain-containing protein YfiP